MSFTAFPPYKSPLYAFNGHVHSIVPTLLRRVSVPFERAKLDLSDGDFLLLDYLRQPDKNTPWVILTHGLEGSTDSHYIAGTARLFHQQGWNVLAWNFRSCGGALNNKPRFYHSGDKEDLLDVIRHLVENDRVNRVLLVGFSMGGSQTLWALSSSLLPKAVIGGVAISVPLVLASCAQKLALPAQKLYMKRFLRDLKPKIQAKARRFPDDVSFNDFDEIEDFYEFDERYTAPLHGFKSAENYWARCSSLSIIPQIKKPTLIVNALDDPFLADDCYDIGASERAVIETPKTGGHVGFGRWRLNSELWIEQRALAYGHYLLENECG